MGMSHVSAQAAAALMASATAPPINDLFSCSIIYLPRFDQPWP